MARAPKKPEALKINGNTLEEFLPLLPAEEGLRKAAAAGDLFIPEDYNDKRPNEATERNTIRAEFLRYMILGGCEKSPVHQVGIAIAGVFIRCEVNSGISLTFIDTLKNIILENCYVDGNTKTLNLAGSFVKAIQGGGVILMAISFWKMDSKPKMKLTL